MLKWIINAVLPLSTIENIYFHQFINDLNPYYQIPCTATLRNKIIQNY